MRKIGGNGRWAELAVVGKAPYLMCLLVVVPPQPSSFLAPLHLLGMNGTPTREIFFKMEVPNVSVMMSYNESTESSPDHTCFFLVYRDGTFLRASHRCLPSSGIIRYGNPPSQSLGGTSTAVREGPQDARGEAWGKRPGNGQQSEKCGSRPREVCRVLLLTVGMSWTVLEAFVVHIPALRPSFYI